MARARAAFGRVHRRTLKDFTVIRAVGKHEMKDGPRSPVRESGEDGRGPRGDGWRNDHIDNIGSGGRNINLKKIAMSARDQRVRARNIARHRNGHSYLSAHRAEGIRERGDLSGNEPEGVGPVQGALSRHDFMPAGLRAFLRQIVVPSCAREPPWSRAACSCVPIHRVARILTANHRSRAADGSRPETLVGPGQAPSARCVLQGCRALPDGAAGRTPPPTPRIYKGGGEFFSCSISFSHKGPVMESCRARR